MPDRRKHRGAHPADETLFARAKWPLLQQAVEHLSWLLSRGYAAPSSLKLVGDRFDLAERQRTAVVRAACSAEARTDRRRRQASNLDVAARELAIDGFNLLTTIEAALAGGVLLLCRDGTVRDMASMHGSYRRVEETRPALQRIGEVLAELSAAPCIWYLDRPVSNSGRLAEVIRSLAEQRAWPWEVQVVADPDPILSRGNQVVVSADSAVLDACGPWLNLAAEIVLGGRLRREARGLPSECFSEPWVVPLVPD